ncbi:DUF2599 domain-containing protein [Pseudomonas sp. COR58]|uniref:DUF2599 domain-containing protein n=1 Tax=Pseudomonas ekonensis TaxID=2842353 RepID=A0ABS6PC64_9PSED|nr:DUF2599 domain-containing protein [Pseudomonas ekonensis]MBV4458052.1 DUF2599 domain-containing protein [Pseudomonas ekonensis]
MNRLCSLLVCISTSTAYGYAYADYMTPDQVGAMVERHLNDRYNSTVQNCGSNGRPAILCSGVLIRGTVYSEAYRFWNPGPASKYAQAFSFLRKDVKFRQLASDHQHGYILLPKFNTPEDMLKPDVLCAFPVDAGSHVRDDNGCGDAFTTAEVENSCQVQSIRTADAWVDAYRANAQSHHRQCGFDLRPANEPQGAPIFMEFIRANDYASNEHYGTVGLSNNEVRIASWPQGNGRNVPVEAVFYLGTNTITGEATDSGKVTAQKDQLAYYTANGRFIPVIKMTLPQDPSQEATFKYLPADQARLEDVTCNQYIDSAVWVKRYDPGAQAERWSLSVIPTDCGRMINAAQTDSFYAELTTKYGSDPQWRELDGGGMRRQLVCLITTFRTKNEWNMEPFRPDTTHEKAVATGCNPI